MRVIHIRDLLYGLALLLGGAPPLAYANSGSPRATSPDVDVAPFVRSIAEVERKHGAVDHRLSEYFLGLGLAHRANGNPNDAASAFQQALHINRINKGLHHLVHVPIVDLLIGSYTALGNGKALEQQHRYRYWIHRRERKTNADDFIDAAVVFAAWQTRAHNFDTGMSSLRHLRDALDALGAALETIDSKHPSQDPRLIVILNAQALAHLNLAMYMSTTVDDPAAGRPMTGDDFGDIIARRDIIIDSLMGGEKALDRIVSMTEIRSPTIQHGLALANRADWELVFDRPQSSARTYRKAYEQLKLAGLSEDELTTEFGSPRPLSKFSLERRKDSEKVQRPSTEPYVTASFDVTKTGTVRNVEVLDAYPSGDSKIIRRARTTLRATRFRPRIGSDGPLEASSTIRYTFPDEAI